jgi:polysaccharide pyruvyl transferase WcaK-like protein
MSNENKYPKKKSTVVTLTGYYGAGNLGDDLMIRGLVNNLLSATNISLNVLQFYDVSTLPFEENERLKIIKIPNNRIKSIIVTAKTLIRSNWLVYGGGTCFTDRSGDGSFKLFMMAKLLGCKIAYLGVGIGKLTRKSRILKTKLLLFISNLTTFRDNSSFIKGIKLSLTSSHSNLFETEDLCYLDSEHHLLLSETFKSSSFITWVISVRPLDQYLSTNDNKIFWKNWIEWIKSQIIIYEPNKILILPIDDSKDISISKMLLDSLLVLEDKLDCKIEIVNKTTSNEKIRILSHSNLIVSMRLHACYLGNLMNIPTFGVSYCQKVTAFYNSIDSTYFSELDSWLTPLVNFPDLKLPEIYFSNFDLEEKKNNSYENIRLIAIKF